MQSKQASSGHRAGTHRFETDFSILDAHVENPETAMVPKARTSDLGINGRALEAMAIVPTAMKEHYKGNPKAYANLWELGKTPRVKGAQMFAQVEHAYIVHQSNLMAHHMTAVAAIRLKEYLTRDLVGVQEIPVTDEHVWQVKKISKDIISTETGDITPKITQTRVKTDFGGYLDLSQSQIYQMLRASLKHYMSEKTLNRVKVEIERWESTQVPPVTDSTMLDRYTRMPWVTIKNFILDDICVLCTGAYHFTPLQIAGRNNGEAFSTWIERVLSLHKNITKYGRGWENIGSMHSVQKLYEWLGNDEQKVIMTEFNRLEDESRHYQSDTELIKGETIDRLIAFLRAINPNKFGSVPFKRSWCTEALQRLLYTHTYVSKLRKQIDAKDKAIAELKAQLKQRGSASTQRNPRKDKGANNNNRDTNPNKGNENNSQVNPENRPDKEAPICQKCLASGLGSRRHWKCDDNLRNKAIAALNRKIRAKKGLAVGNEAAGRKRKFPLEAYDADSCMYCRTMDVDPRYTKDHVKETCYLRPNGPIQKELKCTYIHMVANVPRSKWKAIKSELHRKFREERAKRIEDKKKGRKPNKTNKSTRKAAPAHTPYDPAVHQPEPEPEAEPEASPAKGKQKGVTEPSPVKNQGRGRGRGRGSGRGQARGRGRGKGRGSALIPKKKKSGSALIPKKKKKPKRKSKNKKSQTAQKRRAMKRLQDKQKAEAEAEATHAEAEHVLEQMAQAEAEVTDLTKDDPRKNDYIDPDTISQKVVMAYWNSVAPPNARKPGKLGQHGIRKHLSVHASEYYRFCDQIAKVNAYRPKSPEIPATCDLGRKFQELSRIIEETQAKREAQLNQHRYEDLKDTLSEERAKRKAQRKRAADEEAADQAVQPKKKVAFNVARQQPPQPNNTNSMFDLTTSEPSASSASSNVMDVEPDDNMDVVEEVDIDDIDLSTLEGTGADHNSSAALQDEPSNQVGNANTCRHETLTYIPLPTGRMKPQRLKTMLLRRKGTKGAHKKMMSIPLETWCPSTSVARPIARTNFANTRVSSNANQSDCDDYVSSRQQRRKRLLSETKGYRLLQAYVRYRNTSGDIKIGRIQLDSQSNVNYSLPGISLTRKWNPGEKTTVTGITQNTVELGRPLSFTMLKGTTPIVIDTNQPEEGVLTGNCVALLGVDAIEKLGIDLNYAMRHHQHKWVKYLDSDQDAIMRCDEAKQDFIRKHVAPLTTKELTAHGTTFLSERVIAQYNEAHPDEFVSKPLNLNALEINPNMPKDLQSRFREEIEKRKAAFAENSNTLPKCMNGIEPHMFKVKPGEKARPVPCPKFGPEKAKLIMKWVEWALKVKLIEKSDNTAFASRLILAPKYKANTPKSAPPDGIRVAWAGVDINDTLVKTVPVYTDAWEQMYKVANLKYKFSADGLKQYWTIPLTEEAREMTSFWTPQGLFRFTRMVMGTKNAATVAQNAYTSALHHKLNRRSFNNIANYADDFMGGANDYEKLLEVFTDFLDMCIKAGITLNPEKVRIGFEKEQFFGLTIDNGRITHADRNLDPVRRMVYPKTRSELRSVMGVFNQFGNFIHNYARGPAACLSALSSTKVPYIFTKEHEQAVDEIRKIILSGVHLHAPKPDIPLRLDTDGSDDGWGAVLYQIIEDERYVIKMWSKKWDTEAWQKKPPYHREAKAWMNGMELALPYTLFNKHPLECYTDHSPLTWIKHTSGKGPVSQFIIDKLSLVDYNMHYVKGEDNEVADALSRFPLLGPRTLTRTGLKGAVDILLSALTEAYPLDATKIWFDAGKDTQFLSDEVYEWRNEVHKVSNTLKRIYMDRLSEANIRKLPYTVGIWAPPADKVTHQCLAAFKKGKPFACLIPGDLVAYIPVEKDGTHNTEIAELVQQAGKISFLDSGLVWIIHGASPVRQVFSAGRHKLERLPPINVTYVGERNDPAGAHEPDLDELMRHLRSTNLTPPVDMARTRQEWIQLQAEHRIPLIWQGRAAHTQDGLWYVQEGNDGPRRTIVPRALQIPLIKWKHHKMCHMGWKKVYNELSKQFYWDNMYTMCKREVLSCRICALLKAKRNLAHKHFRAKLFCTPRTAYGSDYYGVKMNEQGYCVILGIIDLSTGNLVLKAAKSASGAHVAETLFHDIILRKGVPLLFHTDAAQAFVGKAVTALAETLGTKCTNTLAHNPKSNAKMERVWEFVGRCLRSMPSEQYANFPRMLPILEHVWNSTPDSETNVTPFEAEHGMPMRNVAQALLENPPPEGLPAEANDLITIAQSAEAYAQHLANVKQVEKAIAANRLNSKGQPKHEYKIGDRVTFYLPPSQKQAQAMGKNPKHMLQYAGPGEITESLSPNGTSWKIIWNGREYQRNIMHLKPYSPDDHLEHQQRAVVDNTVYVNSYVAVMDDTDDNNYHVAKVIGLTNAETTLHYMGTGSKALRSAKWRLMYHKLDNTGYRYYDPNVITQAHEPLTGTIDTRPIEDSLIILPNLGFNNHAQLNKDTVQVLKTFPLRHHVFKHTWP